MDVTPTPTTSAPRVRFVEDFFPLLLCIGPQRFDADAVAEMAAGYERYFVRGDRYSLVTCSPPDSITDAHGRKMIVDWANSPRVRQKSRELCVGSATVVPNAMARGALTALLWVWKPSSPHHIVSTPEEGVDWCLERIAEHALVLPAAAASVRRDALRVLRRL